MSVNLPVSVVVLEQLRHRRRTRLARFIICETIASLLLIASIMAGLSSRFAADSYTPVFRILPVCSAILAAIIPVLFYGNPKRRNRRRRLQ